MISVQVMRPRAKSCLRLVQVIFSKHLCPCKQLTDNFLRRKSLGFAFHHDLHSRLAGFIDHLVGQNLHTDRGLAIVYLSKGLWIPLLDRRVREAPADEPLESVYSPVGVVKDLGFRSCVVLTHLIFDPVLRSSVDKPSPTRISLSVNET